LHGGCYIRTRNCLPFASTWLYPRFVCRVHVAYHLIFCAVFFFLLVFVLFLVCPMLPMSVDCPFVIAVFYKVYLSYLYMQKENCESY
jgi:hypothetical protein